MTFSPRFASRTRRALVTAAALTAVAATGTATARVVWAGRCRLSSAVLNREAT